MPPILPARAPRRGDTNFGAFHELAEAVTLSRGGLTKLVDRLEAGGLLRREACVTDRRGYHAVLTRQGQATLRRMWPVYADVLKEVFVPALGEDEAAAVAASLGRVGASRNDPQRAA
jgi:DNA-binding MarR family transcriptional regulator